MRPVFNPASGEIEFQKAAYPRLQIADPIATSRWTRTANWMAMPAMTGADEKVVALFRVDDHDANFVAFTISGAFTVNWGDGNIENFAAGATATHAYDWNDTDLTDTSGTLGYKQALITITPQGGQQLTAVNLNVRHPAAFNGKVVTNYLDIAISLPNCGASGFVFGTSGTQFAYPAYLEKLTVYNLGSQTSLLNAFYLFPSLREASVSGINSVTSISGMFAFCYQLEKATISAAPSVTDAGNLFNTCYRLQEVSLGAFSSSGWSAANMFNNCYSMINAPAFDASKITNASNMFQSCYALLNVPAYDFASCTNMATMFQFCYAIEEIPLLKNTNLVTNFTSFAASCWALKKVAALNTSGATSLASMFNNCYNLTSVPNFVTSSVTDFTAMFQNCYVLKAIPELNISSATSLNTMFQSCYELTGALSINLTTTNNCTTTNMFNGTNFTSAVITAAPKISGMFAIFSGCLRLASASLPNLPVCTSLASAFSGCVCLENVTISGAPAVTAVNNMFSGCSNLKTPPLFDTSLVTTFASMFINAHAVERVPAYNFNSATTMISSLPNGVSKFLPYNIGISLNLSNLRLSKSALETVFGNLKSGVSAQTITLTGNFGVDTAVTKSGLSSTAKSTTINMADTSGLSVGMLASNSTIWAGVSVTSDVSANTLSLTGHNIPNGTMVSFTALGTTTGVSTNAPYYVVNSAANTFQIALEPGGSAIDLTGSNGSMTVIWWSKIASINPNVSITLDAPAPTSQTGQTISFRLLDARPALAKGWTVTY